MASPSENKNSRNPLYFKDSGYFLYRFYEVCFLLKTALFYAY